MLRRVHDQLALDGAHAVGLMLGVHLVAGDHEGIHVGDGAPGRQDAVAGLEPDDVAHLAETSVLHQDEDGGDLVSEHVRVGRRGQPLARHRDDVQAGRELVEEARVTCTKIAKQMNVIAMIH